MKKILIEVALAHGCSRCSRATEVVSKLVGKRRDVVVKEVNIAEQPEFAVKHGIMSTPAIVINGKLEFRGTPEPKELESVFKKY